MDDIESFTRILNKYRFVEPIPLDVQVHIRKIKGREYRRILKKTGVYSTLTLVSLIILYLIKKIIVLMGYHVKALVLIGALATAAGGAAIIIKCHSFQNINRIHDRGRSSIGLSSSVTSVNKNMPVSSMKSGIVAGPVFSVQLFTSEKSSSDIADMAVKDISDSLREAGASIREDGLQKGRHRPATQILVLGSVELLDGRYVIHVRAVRVKSSEIIFYTAASIRSKNDVPGMCRKISRELLESL
ncbi:MAG TPA: hypothetical protein PK926_14770 [Spirochaetota bacterium]|nr:hypothetical protein [Spirochaetota bacterium]HPI89946.1 hypothetical protein [Spirochaetota bacterium]HPR48455.1 hypothetical protein [Spirochaetota bacterium]